MKCKCLVSVDCIIWNSLILKSERRNVNFLNEESQPNLINVCFWFCNAFQCNMQTEVKLYVGVGTTDVDFN